MESEQPLADWVGLDADEAALYRAMLRAGGPARPERLAAELERTVPDVRSGVERLADLGFLTERGPVAPSLALRSVLHRRLAGLHEQQSALEAAAAQVDRLAAGFLAAEPGSLPVEGIELVVGREEVARRAGDMVATARSEMLVLDAPPYAQVAPPAPDQPCEPFTSAADSDVGQAIARGVKIRRVMAQEALDLPGRMAAISELVELGLSVRVSQVVPTKMMVADGRTALIPPSATADPASQAIVVHDGLLLNVLAPFFEAVWDAAMPLGGASDAPSEADRALLALLAGGLKDEAIARQLDVHVHTARRRISALLVRLGVTTRFQAGMQAARRGWLAELLARCARDAAQPLRGFASGPSGRLPLGAAVASAAWIVELRATPGVRPVRIAGRLRRPPRRTRQSSPPPITGGRAFRVVTCAWQGSSRPIAVGARFGSRPRARQGSPHRSP